MPSGSEIEALVLATLDDLDGQAHRRDIKRRAVQLGRFSGEQLAVPPPPNNTGYFPNKIEFKISFALSNLKRKGKLDNVGNGVWRRI